MQRTTLNRRLEDEKAPLWKPPFGQAAQGRVLVFTTGHDVPRAIHGLRPLQAAPAGCTHT